MLKPRELVEKLEQSVGGPPGWERRFAGYGVMGVAFTSGHILGLRRFPASSLGPGYTSVWHRDPQGHWRVYQNVPPDQASTLYFGRVVAEAVVQDIDLAWSGPDELRVSVPGPCPITWSLSLSGGPAAQFINSPGGLTPGPLWRQPQFLKLMGGIAGLALGAGYLALDGQAPKGQRFISNPRLTWSISDSRAGVSGQDLGEMGPLPARARWSDFWVPQRGLFVMGSALVETFEEPRPVSPALYFTEQRNGQ